MSKICKECNTLKPDYKFTGKSKICHLYYNINEHNLIDNSKINKDRISHLKCKYDLTLEQYNRMLESQYCRCAICEKFQLDPSKKLYIDHCHTSGKVRALLCTRCNTALGLLREDEDILLNMISYIKRFKHLKLIKT